MNPGFEEIMSIRGRGMPEDGEVTITGHDPVFSARFRIDATFVRLCVSGAGRGAGSLVGPQEIARDVRRRSQRPFEEPAGRNPK